MSRAIALDELSKRRPKVSLKPGWWKAPSKARGSVNIRRRAISPNQVIEGEITFTVKGQEPRVLKTGDFIYIPRGTVHRNENKSNRPARTVELLIMDKGKPQNNPAP